MRDQGWFKLLKGYPWYEGEGNYLLRAYSEFMPPPRLGINPYTGLENPWTFSKDDPFGWTVAEIE